MKKINDKIDFNDYAKDYKEITQKNLWFFNNDREYFDSYKVKICKRFIPNAIKILDYGCGIGLCLKHLQKFYPNSEVFGTDVSTKSLEIAAIKYPNVNFFEINKMNNLEFDLIFVAGVFYHIYKHERQKKLKNLKSFLLNSGNLIIFEHNPLNPITRKLVSSCPFDKGVELLNMKELQRIFIQNPIIIVNKGYCLFFPLF